MQLDEWGMHTLGRAWRFSGRDGPVWDERRYAIRATADPRVAVRGCGEHTKQMHR